MVDTGATSHIITDLEKFKWFDDEFQPEKHYIELADGTRASGVALRRGDAEVYMIDSSGTSGEDDAEERVVYPIVSSEHFFC